MNNTARHTLLVLSSILTFGCSNQAIIDQEKQVAEHNGFINHLILGGQALYEHCQESYRENKPQANHAQSNENHSETALDEIVYKLRESKLPFAFDMIRQEDGSFLSFNVENRFITHCAGVSFIDPEDNTPNTNDTLTRIFNDHAKEACKFVSMQAPQARKFGHYYIWRGNNKTTVNILANDTSVQDFFPGSSYICAITVEDKPPSNWGVQIKNNQHKKPAAGVKPQFL